MRVFVEHVWILALLFPALLLLVLGWIRLRHDDSLRRAAAISIRLLVFAAAILALAGAAWQQSHHRISVMAIIDVSGSVRRLADLPEQLNSDAIQARSTIEYLRNWVREVAKTRPPDDRLGVIVFDGRATAISAPTTAESDDQIDVSVREGTNIAAAIRLGRAMLPPDTAGRLLLISDGVETLGDARDAAAVAGGVPIDVGVIDYAMPGDVQVVRIEAPTTADPGQLVPVRVVLRSTGPARGRLSLQVDGAIVDLDPTSVATSSPVDLPAGLSVKTISFQMADRPVSRLKVLFEPETASDDSLKENDSGEAVVISPGRGHVLIVRNAEGDGVLAASLRAAEISTQTISPSAFPRDLLTIQAHDLVVLDNVDAAEFDPPARDLLATAVEEHGVGLLMTGGDHSFGVGGWKGTAIEKVLPVALDVPKELRLPTSALVLVLDKSGSMDFDVAGARATQQQIANEAAALAIESLRQQSYVGVVAFDFAGSVVVPIQLNEDPKPIADLVRGIRPEGGTNIGDGMRLGLNLLQQVPAQVENRHMVILTDGRSDRGEIEGELQRAIAAGITVTTIGVGDDVDEPLLSAIASQANGRFFSVRDPRLLPRVLVDSVRVVNQPLIRERTFTPQLVSGAEPFLAPLAKAPPLHGIVLTAPRAEPTASIDLVGPEGEPVFAHWQAGLGRVAAFTSDVDGPWGRDWAGWSDEALFWVGVAQWAIRPRLGGRFDLAVQTDEDAMLIRATANPDEALGVSMTADVYDPDGRKETVRLHQSGPGTFEARLQADSPGNWIVAVKPYRAGRPVSPMIGAVTVSSGDEYRRLQSNPSLLEDIAARTGGRVISLVDPRESNVFDRSSLPTTTWVLPAWRWLIWLVLSLFLFDVAARRLAWSGSGIWSWMRRAWRREAPRTAFEVTGAVATVTRRRVVPTSAVETETVKVHWAGQSSESKPDPSRVAEGLAALQGRAPTKEERSAEPAAPPSTTSEVDSVRSSLLDAKRRAQEQFRRKDP